MFLHDAVWFEARVRRVCSLERCELTNLVSELNAPWLTRLRARACKAAAAEVAKRRVTAAVAAGVVEGMEKMVEVVVPSVGGGVVESFSEKKEEKWSAGSEGVEMGSAESVELRVECAAGAGEEEECALSMREEGDVESEGGSVKWGAGEDFWAVCKRLHQEEDLA
ncbi:hypothetical protein AJ78_08416 [Emergomyces pasteurianus Ep9510]|uniref:Uncharacterized protein n=1 Tax=Emergomyces pasteurianus Ep9510 TaxID=1447872 RepID=A0A1J9P434_9EURO|nr:hypothetical protein AJ78_08416 [Emergomyces pasteurianus Ep9510]